MLSIFFSNFISQILHILHSVQRAFIDDKNVILRSKFFVQFLILLVQNRRVFFYLFLRTTVRTEDFSLDFSKDLINPEEKKKVIEDSY